MRCVTKSGLTGSRPFRWLMRANKPIRADRTSAAPTSFLRSSGLISLKTRGVWGGAPGRARSARQGFLARRT
jgi:hypothetical protein